MNNRRNIRKLEIERDMYKADRDAIMKEFDLEISDVVNIRSGNHVRQK